MQPGIHKLNMIGSDMMADLINRKDAIDAFKKELTVGESKRSYVTICSAIGYEGAKKILESLPSAQPERKTGRWTIKNGELAIWDVCSECGRMVIHKAPFYNFCPHCGADMRGKKNEIN